MEWKVYILWNDKRRTYTGCAQDELLRLQKHNKGEVTATRNHRPWEIIYTENTSDYKEARRREKYFKSSAGRRRITKILKDAGKIS